MKLLRVAWRGLWDRFAAPESLDAIHRALRKGFATRIRAKGPADLQQAAQLFLNHATNPQRMPVLVAFDDREQLTPFLVPGHPPFFAHDNHESGSLLHFEEGTVCDRKGLYLELETPVADGDWPWIAVEAPDTRSLFDGPARPNRIQELATKYPTSLVLHLLDLVELDCLNAQPRWDGPAAESAADGLNVTFPTEELSAVLSELESPGLVIGLVPPPALPHTSRLQVPTLKIDAFLQLTPQFGFEQQPLLVTWGLRRSRFAPILFWEAFHTLAPEGRWLDLDLESQCHGTPLCTADYPERPYFATSLTLEQDQRRGALRIRSWRKTSASGLSDQLGDGWSFGILTCGPSPQAARMAKQILALGNPEVEVIICGPKPDGLPADPRVRVIDLDQPEPRGWITRKKNLLAQAARYPNLCLLHDRFEIPSDFFAAMKRWGPLFGVIGLPNHYQADRTGEHVIRYADYQTLLGTAPRSPDERYIYNEDNICNLDYADYQGAPFICGGAYIAKRKLFLAVGQDESLFHCEWEDVAFGLECLRHGVPHRVNPFTSIVSTSPHILGLTHLQFVDSKGTICRSVPILDENWARAASCDPKGFKPLLKATREAYFDRLAKRWNTIGLGDTAQVAHLDLEKVQAMSELWDLFLSKAQAADLRTREQIAAIIHFAASTIYNWPSCIQQRWLLENEEASSHRIDRGNYSKRIGWGAGTMLADFVDEAHRDLSYVVDRDRTKWGQVIHGFEVRPPASLRNEAPDCLVVILCSRVAEIREELEAWGQFPSVAAFARYGRGIPFHPLDFMAAYFREVERYYPAVFAPLGSNNQ